MCIGAARHIYLREVSQNLSCMSPNFFHILWFLPLVDVAAS